MQEPSLSAPLEVAYVSTEQEVLALVAELAAWEDACLCDDEECVGQCSACSSGEDCCGGTGRLARFPSLRQVCERCHGLWPIPSCFICGGKGWLPDASDGAMWRLLTVDMREGLPAIAQVHVWGALQLAVALGEDARLALLLAVKVAMVARGG